MGRLPESLAARAACSSMVAASANFREGLRRRRVLLVLVMLVCGIGMVVRDCGEVSFLNGEVGALMVPLTLKAYVDATAEP